MDKDLESLYKEAQSALRSKDYDRASGLLKQILVIDENYKDASRLLAQSVQLKRRRWYNDPRVWGTVGAILVVGLFVWLIPKLSLEKMSASPEPAATITTAPSSTPLPTQITIPTFTLMPAPTSIPLVWKRVNIGQEFERDKIVAFVIDPKDSDVLYAHMENAGYYQSIDGGISWRPIQIENVPAEISRELITDNDHNQIWDFSVTNTGPDGVKRIYRAGSNWLISENGGESWSEFGIIGWPPSNAITFDSQGSLYVYCDSHLCKYSPDGKQKTTLGKPDVGVFTIITISPFDPNTIYVAGNGLSVSKDGGLSWSILNNGLGTMYLALETGNGYPPTLYLQMGKCDETQITTLSRQNQRTEPGQPLYVSNNGGQSWDPVLQTGCSLIKDANGSTIYRVGKGVEYLASTDGWIGWLWRSDDDGKSWQKIPAPSGGLTLVAHLTQSGKLLYYPGGPFGDPSRQLVSEDYGHKWKSTNPPLSPKLCYGLTLQLIEKYRPMAIDPRDQNHVFVIDNGALRASNNSCDTTYPFWTAPNTSINSIAFDTQTPDTLYAGTDDGAYISFDSGKTWNQINDGLLGATVAYSIVVDKDSNVYAATPYGIFKLEKK